MHGIYPMAAVTVVAAAVIWGAMLYVLLNRTTRYLWLVLLGLPLSAAINLGVKRPIGTAVASWAAADLDVLHVAPVWFLVFLLLLSPVTEELGKLAPLLLGPARRLVMDGPSALWVGAALGIGFGIGEAAFLAEGVARSGQHGDLPWYAFTGFFYERIAVTFGHGVMTAIAVAGLWRGGAWRLAGLVMAMCLHAVANIGAFLYQLDLLTEQWSGLWFVTALIVMTSLFEGLRRRLSALPLGADPAEIHYYARDAQRP